MNLKRAKRIRRYLRQRGVDVANNNPDPSGAPAPAGFILTRRNVGGRRIYRDFKKGMRHV